MVLPVLECLLRLDRFCFCWSLLCLSDLFWRLEALIHLLLGRLRQLLVLLSMRVLRLVMLASFRCRYGWAVDILACMLAFRNLLLVSLLGDNFPIVDIFRLVASKIRGSRVRVVVLLGLGGVMELAAHMMLLVSILGLGLALAEVRHLGMLLLLGLLEHITEKILRVHR